MPLRILVTGATGNVGREVIRLLATRDCEVRAAVRDPAKAQQILEGNVDCVPFDFTEPATFISAFTGVQKLFLVRPPALANVRKQIAPALKAAKQAGVEQVVFLSLLGAERNRVMPHFAIERTIEQLGIPVTFLRPSFFMQNLNTTHQEDIRQGELFMPAGNGRTSFIDVRDIAAVVVKALTEDGHQHQAYALTGAEALTYYEVADIFTEVLGKPIRYTNPSLLRFIGQMWKRKLPLNFILVMAGIYTTARSGLADTVTTDVARLLGRPPISLKQYVEDYQSCWL
jgi:uncharacterized protein YbjT (DUF2867 family)